MNKTSKRIKIKIEEDKFTIRLVRSVEEFFCWVKNKKPIVMQRFERSHLSVNLK